MNPIKNESSDNGSSQPKNTLPFSLPDAVAGKPVIHEYKRKKAVQVVYVETLPESRRVLVVFEDGEYGFYSVTGQSADGCVRLWMDRMPGPVPFTVDGWKKGWKPVYRDGTFPREVHVFETATCDQQATFSINANGRIVSNGIDGSYVAPGEENQHPRDLLLIPPFTP